MLKGRKLPCNSVTDTILIMWNANCAGQNRINRSQVHEMKTWVNILYANSGLNNMPIIYSAIIQLIDYE